MGYFMLEVTVEERVKMFYPYLLHYLKVGLEFINNIHSKV